MMELCTNNKLFIRVEEVEKNFEIEKQLVTHCLDTEELMTKLTNHFAVYVSLPSSSATNISNEELAKIEKRKAKNRQKKLKRQDKRKAKLEEKQKLAKNMPETPIADELLEKMGDKNSATNWQQIAKIYDQSAPFWKQFDLNVLQLSGTDTIILDVVAALSLTMTIRAQNGGVHNEKIAVNEGGDCYCVLLYCYKMTTETTDHQQKELVIFGNPEVDGVPGSGGDQKVVINVELGNLDELPNCQNDELFIYIERDRFGEEHAKPTTMTIPTAQFENNIEDGKMTINLS
uniref:Uncharacterized protein n=1 Tax=Globodera rostochiensis TaxID=31243 RepID=A0A914HUU3_GLORO